MGVKTSTLVLVRHGQSEWNATNQFTGWYDCDLTKKGVTEALAGAKLLKEAKVLPEVLHTSLQKRAIKTADLIIDELQCTCLLYTSPSPRDQRGSRMPSSA